MPRAPTRAPTLSSFDPLMPSDALGAVLMPSDPLAAVGVAVWATFIIGMLFGIALMFASALVRRRGSALAARLLLSGPPGGLVGASLYVLSLGFFPVLLRLLFAALFLTTAIPVFVWLVRAKMSFAPIGRARN